VNCRPKRAVCQDKAKERGGRRFLPLSRPHLTPPGRSQRRHARARNVCLPSHPPNLVTIETLSGPSPLRIDARSALLPASDGDECQEVTLFASRSSSCPVAEESEKRRERPAHEQSSGRTRRHFSPFFACARCLLMVISCRGGSQRRLRLPSLWRPNLGGKQRLPAACLRMEERGSRAAISLAEAYQSLLASSPARERGALPASPPTFSDSVSSCTFRLFSHSEWLLEGALFELPSPHVIPICVSLDGKIIAFCGEPARLL